MQRAMKKPTSYRLSATGLELIDLLSTKLGLSQASLIEMVVREEAGRRGIPYEEKEEPRIDVNSLAGASE